MTEKIKKLNTNQMMKVRIGSCGTIEIGHKTEMGKVSQVIEMGNAVREKKGLRPLESQEILGRRELWEFVIARNTQQFKYDRNPESTASQKSGELLDFKTSLRMEQFSDFDKESNTVSYSNFGELEKYKDLLGRIQYSELMKKFPHLIKSKRGRNGGTWAELYILLKIASMLDKDLEVAIYDVFIKSQILQHRDNGGDNFKKLNIAIDKYIPSESGNSQGRFIQISKLLRKKLEITSTKGYNEEEHNSNIQKQRDDIEKNLIFSLESKLVTSYEQLKIVAEDINVVI